jgi:hypothetical protein
MEIQDIREGIVVNPESAEISYQWDNYIQTFELNILFLVYDGDVVARKSLQEKKVKGLDYYENQGALEIKNIHWDFLQTYRDIREKEDKSIEEYGASLDSIARYENEIRKVEEEKSRGGDVQSLETKLSILSRALKSSKEKFLKYKKQFNNREYKEVIERRKDKGSKIYYIIPVSTKRDLVKKRAKELYPELSKEELTQRIRELMIPLEINQLFGPGMTENLGFAENLVVAPTLLSTKFKKSKYYYNVYNYLTKVVEYFLKHLHIHTIKAGLMGPGAVGKTTLKKILFDELKEDEEEKMTWGYGYGIMGLDKWVDLYD